MDCKYCRKYIGDEPQDDFCGEKCKKLYLEEINNGNI